MATARYESQAAFNQALQTVSAQWPYTITKRQFEIASAGKISRWAQCATIYPHIVSLSKNYEELAHMKKTETPNMKLVDLLCEAAWFQYEKGEGPEAVPLLEHAAVICDEAGEKAKLHLKSVYGCWIGVASTIGDAKKLFHYCKLRLDFAEAEFKENGVASSFLAIANNDMGQAYSMNHLPDKAIPYLERSKNIRSGLPGFQKDWLFSPSYHLALAYTCLGNHETAFEIIQQAINDRIAVLGPNDRISVRTGALYYVAGNIQNSRGLFDDAFGWHQKALLHCKQTAGETGLVTLRCMNKVAEHNLRHKYESAARPMLQTVLDICGTRSSRQREVARASFLLAQVAAHEMKFAEAKTLKQRAAAIYNQMRPDDHREPGALTQEDVESLIYYDFL